MDDGGLFLILGVDHTDPRLPQLIPDQVNEEVAKVCHETPSEGTGELRPLLLASPGYTVLVPLQLAVVRAKGLWNRYSGRRTVPVGNPLMQCRRAAHEIADEHNVSVVGIGLSPRDRAALIPLRATVLSWITVGFFVLAMVLAVSAILRNGVSVYTIPPSFLFIMISLISIAAVRAWTLKQVEDLRDKGMFQNILNAKQDVDDRTVVAIVGEDHVEGIANRVEEAGYECEWQYVSSGTP